MRLGRRELLLGLVSVPAVLRRGGEAVTVNEASRSHFTTRGVVLTPDDLTLADWPERAARAGLTTIALHPTPAVVLRFIESDTGKAFLKKCAEAGLDVEYELHAAEYLLPRDLFDRDPSMFRMDTNGQRVREGNMCVSSSKAVDIVAERALELSETLRPTTSRYFLWGDDAVLWCRCSQCRALSDSDQALMLANHLARVLRERDRKATVAYLAYHNTLAAPRQVKPEHNVFLEFAPIHRRYDVPFEQQTDERAGDTLAALVANLDVFDVRTAQILEYWLDLSRFSGWRRPTPRLPWHAPLVLADLDAYGSMGVRQVTTFAVYLDAEYVKTFGEPPAEEYGRLLSEWRPRRRHAARPADVPVPSPDSLTDPFREELVGAGSRMPELMEACAEPLHGEPAFDPAMIWHEASRLQIPGLSDEPVPKGTSRARWLLDWSVRIGLAHINATFRGDHPRYGVGAYVRQEHDGFPPTIIAAVDALSQWGLMDRAQELLTYWLQTFVGDDGSIRYYAPSLSEYGQLLALVRSLLTRGAGNEWLSRNIKQVAAIAQRISDLTGTAARPVLAGGIPEADTASDSATYFHNNAWLWRGLVDWGWMAEHILRMHREAEALEQKAMRLRLTLVRAIRDTWPRDPDDWWLRPMVESEGTGTMARPLGRVTASRLGSYTNYRYWPELLSSGVLPEDLMRRVVKARQTGGGQWLGLTRFEDHADNWPLVHYLEGLWVLRMRSEYSYVLWGHILFHQARGHMTAYEQISLPPGRMIADYCLPSQLVAARTAKRLLREVR